MVKQLLNSIHPTERICNHTGSSNLGKYCIGEKCAQFRYVRYGGYGHENYEGGCVDFHLPQVIRKIDW